MIDPGSLVPRLVTRGPVGRATAELVPALRLRGVARPAGRLTLFGVPLRLDVSWVFGVALATWTFADAVLPAQAPDRGAGVYVAAGALTALLVFVSLALHEVGHWLAARRAGLPVVRLGVSLVGGELELGAVPRSPAVELRLALGGPLASLATAAIAGLVHVVLVEAAVDPLLCAVAAVVAVANLGITVLNLFPGLPLDGGRTLRAVVWALTGNEPRATRVATVAGRTLGITFLLVAVVASASGDAAAAIWSGALGLTIHHHA
ncbi:MAG TPA: site-2 protease family protein [Methylomirabilota bacterium]|nr:site-2 protease family protein [Methylomirabilota bacterium]